jgi:hypothetical protein
MVRDLTYILKEKRQGLGLHFPIFNNPTWSKLIFKRAYLMPAIMGFTMRSAELSE